MHQVTDGTTAIVVQDIRACCASLFEADTFGIPDGTTVFVFRTTYQAQHRSIEHCRDAWPSDAARTTELLRLGIEGM